MRFFVLTGIFRLYILHLTPSTKKHPKSDFFLLFLLLPLCKINKCALIFEIFYF